MKTLGQAFKKPEIRNLTKNPFPPKFEHEWNLWTDGACQPNPGIGGVGAILAKTDWSEIYLFLGSTLNKITTNNRMEMLAVIYPLEYFKLKEFTGGIKIYTDSQYLTNTMNLGWAKKKNLDLWDAFEVYKSSFSLDWNWVKGHKGHLQQEFCDKMAVTSIKEEMEPSVYGIDLVAFDKAVNGDIKSFEPEFISTIVLEGKNF